MGGSSPATPSPGLLSPVAGVRCHPPQVALAAVREGPCPRQRPPPRRPASPQTSFRCVRCGAPALRLRAVRSLRHGADDAGNAPLVAVAQRAGHPGREARVGDTGLSRRDALGAQAAQALGPVGHCAWPCWERSEREATSRCPTPSACCRAPSGQCAAPCREPSKPPPLVINSEPEGARVVVGGQDKGTTPLLMDNDYPAGRGDPRGAEPARLQAVEEHLPRQRPGPVRRAAAEQR